MKELCKKSKVQEYQCQVFAYPFWDKTKKVGFDVCLGAEILYLWSLGIKTTGCCCGKHSDSNNFTRYINIDQENKEMLSKMINELNYPYTINEFGTYCFNPKSLFNSEVFNRKGLE